MKIPYINWIPFDKDNQNYETFGNDVPFFII